MTLEQALINEGENIMPMDLVYVLEYIFGEYNVYCTEFWRFLDDPTYEEIRKREAVKIDWRIFYLLN